MTHSFMMCSRDETDDGFGYRLAPMRFFVSDQPAGELDQKASWIERDLKQFTNLLQKEVLTFPRKREEDNEEQKHLSLFVHGYNSSWVASVKRYASIQSQLYEGDQSLGVLVLYTWPSDGNVAGYLPDRADAKACAPELADILVQLHDQIIKMQRVAAASTPSDIGRMCRAKISVIAHSMGAFVMQNALADASKRLNNPQLVTLIHQLALVAADVDNDIFDKSQPLDSDGILMTNLCYRIASLYSGLDSVLGASAGLKHFGKRRLGRSGLSEPANVPDNVFERNVTPLIQDTPGSPHSAVFESPAAMDLLRQILIGVDRRLLNPPPA
jgi:esterase/lipase superfamily enzyme